MNSLFLNSGYPLPLQIPNTNFVQHTEGSSFGFADAHQSSSFLSDIQSSHLGIPGFPRCIPRLAGHTQPQQFSNSSFLQNPQPSSSPIPAHHNYSNSCPQNTPQVSFTGSSELPQAIPLDLSRPHTSGRSFPSLKQPPSSASASHFSHSTDPGVTSLASKPAGNYVR